MRLCSAAESQATIMTSHVSFDHAGPSKAATYLRDDQRFVLHGVPWETYVALRDTLDERSGAGLRMTYLKGTLELMSPSRSHEDYKTIIARLVEAYAEENDLDLRGFGSTTFRRKAKKRGLEPDECYSLGRLGKRPDIAIEVIVSAGYVDKLAVYQGLEVPEVWRWEDGKLTVHRLTDHGYEQRSRSEELPGLDLDHLAGFVVLDANQTQQVKAYRRSLRAQGA
ncbi:MAG: Uma2 family endonuclease [Minicystis sp.]